MIKRVVFGITLLVPAMFCFGNDANTAPKSIWETEVVIDSNGKYGIEGPFGVGDPVHETLSIEAMRVTGLSPSGTTAIGQQVLRGVFWNDDPCAQLFAESPGNPLSSSTGAGWFITFQQAKRQATTAKGPLDFSTLTACPLLGYSHFGSLQYLHGMATKDGELPATTLAHIQTWVSFMYRVARGTVAADRPLTQSDAGSDLFEIVGPITPKTLLRAETNEDTRFRALGAAMHTIQDSFAHGHVNRTTEGIQQFLSYGGQNARKHAHDDEWSKGQGTNLQKTLSVPGAREALAGSIILATAYRDKIDWPQLSQQLADSVFKLSPSVAVAGPGNYK